MNRRTVLAASSVLLGVTSQAKAQSVKGGVVRRGNLRLYVARPDAPGRAGVLLHPTIAGLEPRMTRIADAFAQEGFTAVVWDPYDGEDQPIDTMLNFARSKLLTDVGVVQGITRTTDFMQKELGLEAIGSIGWCLGGRTALLHAGLDPRIQAVSAYNPTLLSATPVNVWGQSLSKADVPGQTMDEMAIARKIVGPVQVVRPGHDICQPAEYETLRQALYSRAYPTIFEYHPEAEHGFSYTLDKPASIKANALAWPSSVALFRSGLLQGAAPNGRA